MMAKVELDPNRLEVVADIDIDGAVFEVGVQHYAIGTAGAGIRIDTGAICVTNRTIQDCRTWAAKPENRRWLEQVRSNLKEANPHG